PPPPQFAPPPPPLFAAPPQPQYAPPPQFAAAPMPQYGGVQPWPFQVSVAAQGDSLAKSMGLAKPGQPQGLLEMMFRAAFLDWNVYRRAVADTGGGQDAWKALAIPSAAAALGGYLTTLSLPGFSGLFLSIGMVAVQLVGFAAAVGIMSALSQSVLQRKVEFGQLFRPMAYAQSVGVLGFLPVIGQLVGLWRIPTSLVAIREAAQCDGGKAAVLLIIGAVGATVATLVLAPVIYSVFRMFG
ncbi:MAG: hypothetical protein NTY38_16475, partial [Acidobacteria bacterium]|nr:hypothetical protein [Acidobacteriota bacterium]